MPEEKQEYQSYTKYEYQSALNTVERRLDAVARILAGTDDCAAVAGFSAKDNKKGINLIITDNSQFARQKGLREDKLPHNMLFQTQIIQYFQALHKKQTQDKNEHGEKEQKNEKELFRQIMQHYVRVQTNKNNAKHKPKEADIDHVSEFLYWKDLRSSNNLEALRKELRKEYEQKYENDDIFSHSMLKRLIALEEACRVARDFQKLKKFFQSYQLQEAQLLAIGEKKKKKTLHAEIKLVLYLLEQGYLRQTPKQQQIYIGLTKLCCAYCAAFLSAMNETLRRDKQDQYKQDQSSLAISTEDKSYTDLEEAQTAAVSYEKEQLEENIQDNDETDQESDQLSVGGQHGLTFSWLAPCVLDTQQQFLENKHQTPQSYLIKYDIDQNTFITDINTISVNQDETLTSFYEQLKNNFEIKKGIIERSFNESKQEERPMTPPGSQGSSGNSPDIEKQTVGLMDFPYYQTNIDNNRNTFWDKRESKHKISPESNEQQSKKQKIDDEPISKSESTNNFSNQENK